MTDSLYEKLSEERKAEQAKGHLPPWYSTGGYQMFKSKYLYGSAHWKGQIKRICRTAAKHTDDYDHWKEKFFELFWNGWLSPSTPVLANMGTDRGLPVSCSGCYVDDSVAGFYEAATEIAVLSKHGFGTSAYIGDIRGRGEPISIGGKASGVMPVVNMLTQVCRDISQGSSRRGAGAWYYDIDGADFWELIKHLEAHPDDLNVGWNITNRFIEQLNEGDEDAISRWQHAMKVKLTLGKGYFFFIDKANDARPQWYKDHGLDICSSNLCTEIVLHQSHEYTFTCVLSSMNDALYDEWKDTDAVFTATVFLDCVASEFIERAKNIKHLQKAVHFTEKGRALGLGQMGLFSLFQKRGLDAESLEAHMLNNEVAKHIHDESERATRWMAEKWGEPEWCEGYGRRNTHLQAIAPTKSTALLMGGWSEGINPDPAMAFSSSGAAGDIDRVNPVLLDIIKKKKLDVAQCTSEILADNGSVQNVKWLTDEQKTVFKTAFEIDQSVLVRMASSRQRQIDQAQSLNLFFAHDDDEAYISKVHQEAFLDPNILSLYYVYSNSEIKAERTGECIACQ